MKGTTLRRAAALLILIFLAPLGVLALGSPEKEGSGGSAGGDAPNKEINYLGIASLMIKDGNYERAEKALSKVDPRQEDLDEARYYTLRGLLSLRRSNFEEAIDSFARAIDAGQENNVMYVYLSQAHYGLGNHRKTLEAVEKVENINRYPALIGIKSQSYWETGRKRKAFETIDRAYELFPSRNQFLQQKIFYLIELDLNQAAAELSRTYLQQSERGLDAYLTIAEALRRGGEKERAIRLMEMANLQYPGSERARLSLAHSYARDGHPLIAARILEKTAAGNRSLYHEAAELYRRAEQYNRAMYLNSLLTRQRLKSTQRFNLLIAMNKYEEALALERRLQRLGALEEDNMRYAMAYVHFQAQHFDQAIEYLNQITGSEYFRKATQLRKAIESVRNEDIQYF